jgi:hypothetical protein
MARIVIPSLTADSVAKRCLEAEGMHPEVHVLHDNHAYAQLVAELWRDGETFAIIEDDIAPWPGAIRHMLDCPRHWCGYHYCLPGRWDADEEDVERKLWGTTGCYKVSAAVMAAAPTLYERWDRHDWWHLDVAIYVALRHVLGLDASPVEHMFHVHKPAVAHAMHYRPEASDGRRHDQEHEVHVGVGV